jgi:hypothetical protein
MDKVKQAESKQRGRPVTGRAMSNAERQKAYRDRKREQKIAMANSRNALQELPDDGSPRRLLAELDRAQRELDRLRIENQSLRERLSLVEILVRPAD